MTWADAVFLFFFDPEQGMNLTHALLGGLVGIGGALAGFSLLLHRPRVARAGVVLGLTGLAAWLLLWGFRPAWLRHAAEDGATLPVASPWGWMTQMEGLETADVRLMVAGDHVDTMSLVRLDPARFDFRVHWDPEPSRTIDEWQQALGAAVVINGSYFMPDATPATPLRMAGRWVGPGRYTSTHGALAMGAGFDIVDLRDQDRDLHEALSTYQDAMVSYPLLVDRQGQTRATGGRSDWLASRTFVGLDPQGRVLFGFTQTGYFSLERLGRFLESGPIELAVALNLDGGPLAAQAVIAGAFRRTLIGAAEIQETDDVLRAFYQAHARRRWRLPIVLAASLKDAGT